MFRILRPSGSRVTALPRRHAVTTTTCRALSSTPSKTADTTGMKKVYKSADDAVADMKGDSVLLSGGFGLCGTPDTLIEALSRRPEVKNITAVSNNAGVDTKGLGVLLHSGQIGKMMCSYIGANKHFEQLYLNGKISLELNPQGSIAERCRAGGAGIPAFYTPSGFGTPVETGMIPIRYDPNDPTKVLIPGIPREVRHFNGRGYLLEEAIKGDYAFIRVWKADHYGNCVFRYSQQNFSGAMARSAKMTIVEAEHIVEPGELDPGQVHLPGIFVNRICPATAPKQIENTVLRTKTKSSGKVDDPKKAAAKLRRELIVKRAARELKDGMYVNLGIGMPMLAPGFLEPGTTVHMQSENGILGMGPYPSEEEVDADIINAGKETVTLLKGASTFDSSESFAMIRGGHVDVSMLGAMEVSSSGDLANWIIPSQMVKGMGGAMDLVSNPDQTKIVIVMDHTDKHGNSKILDQCTLPLTGFRCVSQVITELAVFDINRNVGQMTLTELQPGTTLEEVKAKTSATFDVASDLKSAN